MPFTFCGSWAAFIYALQGVFSLCGAFSFFGCVFLYAVFVFVRCVAFLAALRWCFRFGVAVCVLLFVLICSVMAKILLVLRFVVVGSILYRVIFYPSKIVLKSCESDMSIFCHFIPFLPPFFPIFQFFGQRSAQRVGFFFQLFL